MVESGDRFSPTPTISLSHICDNEKYAIIFYRLLSLRRHEEIKINEIRQLKGPFRSVMRTVIKHTYLIFLRRDNLYCSVNLKVVSDRNLRYSITDT